jgi:hypothetical protein
VAWVPCCARHARIVCAQLLLHGVSNRRVAPVDGSIRNGGVDKREQPRCPRVDRMETWPKPGNELAMRCNEEVECGGKGGIERRAGRAARFGRLKQQDRLLARPAVDVAEGIKTKAIAPLSGSPQLIAILEIAIDGACGP